MTTSKAIPPKAATPPSRHTCSTAAASADRHLVVEETSAQLCGQPKLIIGSKPIDDGNYIFEAEEREKFLNQEPSAAKYLRPFVGSEEFINGGDRSILYLENAGPPGTSGLCAHVMRRIAAVKEFRKASKSSGTRALGDLPAKFHVTVVPDRPFLVIPKVTCMLAIMFPSAGSNRRSFRSDLVFVDGCRPLPLRHSHLAACTCRGCVTSEAGSKAAIDTLSASSITHSPGHADDKQRVRTRDLAQAVLNARAKFPGATMADLYDSDVMKPELLHAHRALDTAVDRLYRPDAFPGRPPARRALIHALRKTRRAAHCPAEEASGPSGALTWATVSTQPVLLALCDKI